MIAFLLGFGDSMYQNQMVSLIGLIYPEEHKAAASIAICQSVQGVFAGAAFFYASYISLQEHSLELIILTPTLSAFEIIDDETLIIQKWLPSRLFANNLHKSNFTEHE